MNRLRQQQTRVQVDRMLGLVRQVRPSVLPLLKIAFSLPAEGLEVADRFFRAGFAWP